MTVIDYSLPSTAPRLWVLDLARHRVLFHELVAHGAGSGDNFATRFSNEPDSRQTSLGLFLTGGTYEGGNGYSLRLRGLEPGVNDLAAERNIVIHGAWYVSVEHASRYGRLGRSWGCPALPQEVAGTIIDTIKDGSFVFAYAAGDGGGPRVVGGSRLPGCVLRGLRWLRWLREVSGLRRRWGRRRLCSRRRRKILLTLTLPTGGCISEAAPAGAQQTTRAAAATRSSRCRRCRPRRRIAPVQLAGVCTLRPKEPPGCRDPSTAA